MTSKFKSIKLTAKQARCAACKKIIEQGSDCFWRHNTASLTFFDVVCDEFCLADFNAQFQPPLDIFLERLARQFN